jgi:hypothetical protein
MDSGAKMLLSEPTTKKAARAKGKTWRQEILDIGTTSDDEFAADGMRPSG